MRTLVKKGFIPTLLAGWTLYYFLDVFNKDARTGALIKPVSIVVFVLYAVIMAGEIRSYLKSGSKAESEDRREEQKAGLINMIICLSITAAYILLMPYAGFVISTSAYLAIMYWYAKAGKIQIIIPCSAAIAAILFMVFSKLLSVPLPVNGLGF